MGGKSHHAIAVTSRATNIVDDTLRLRMTVALPPRFVVIAEPAASLIVMECIGKNSRVIWCDASDVRKLSQPQSLRAPQIWSSYSQFFDYLLAEEESERNEST